MDQSAKAVTSSTNEVKGIYCKEMRLKMADYKRLRGKENWMLQ